MKSSVALPLTILYVGGGCLA